MATKTITLTSHQLDVLYERLNSGDYDGPEAVVSAALEQLTERDRYAGWLRAELAKGLEQIERGEVIEYGEGFFDRAWERAKGRHRAGAPIHDTVRP